MYYINTSKGNLSNYLYSCLTTIKTQTDKQLKINHFLYWITHNLAPLSSWPK